MTIEQDYLRRIEQIDEEIQKLRNEALLGITQDDWQDKDCYCTAVNLCATTARMLGFPDTELMYYNWENMYEQFLELIGEPLIQDQFSMLRTM